MRICTWNVCGLRAALRKGFAKHLREVAPDVLLLQEIRVRPEQLTPSQARPSRWKVRWHPAEKLGYAGVSAWTRAPHLEIGRGHDAPDPEGRVLGIQVGDVEVWSIYLPSGASGPAAQARKDAFCDAFLPFAAARARAPHPVIFGGDLNIAPTPADIHDPKGNAKNSGFLPHERAWFADLLGTGLHDLVRIHFPDRTGPWSWWSNRGRARIEDRGWRIDHLLGNEAARLRLRGAGIHRPGGLEVSDHAPVWVDLAHDGQSTVPPTT